MKLKSIRLRNFCCFADSGIMPIHDMTIFIGENDSGKSSILKALSIFFDKKTITIEEFRKVSEKYRKKCEIELVFSVEDENNLTNFYQYIIQKKIRIKKVFKLTGTNNKITEQLLVKKYVFTKKELNSVRDLKSAELKKICSEFNLKYTTVDETKTQILDYIRQNFTSLHKKPEYFEEKWSLIAPILPAFDLYDSSDYKNPTNMVQKTLEKVYRGYFYEYDGNMEKLKPDFKLKKTEIEENLNKKIEDDLKLKIQGLIKTVKKVSGKFSIDFAKGFNLKTLMIDKGKGENPLSNIGDGSKKRLFLVISEWDKDVSGEQKNRQREIRCYDEPDASLHYKAQKDMFYSLEGRSKDKNEKMQVIICTHSIAMVDRAPPRIINHINYNDCLSSISYLKGDDDKEIKDFLDSISEISGIRNSSLFFERCFLIVEGETEYNFFPTAYKKIAGKSLSEDGIVIVNLKGNSAWQPFLKLLHKNKSNATVLLLDSDSRNSNETNVTERKLMEIGFPQTFIDDNVFFIGETEFEDEFSNEQICRCLNKYWKKETGSEWIEQEIQDLRNEEKFSNALKNMLDEYRQYHNANYDRFGKPEFGKKLAVELTAEEIMAIETFNGLITKLKNIVS